MVVFWRCCREADEAGEAPLEPGDDDDDEGESDATVVGLYEALTSFVLRRFAATSSGSGGGGGGKKARCLRLLVKEANADDGDDGAAPMSNEL